MRNRFFALIFDCMMQPWTTEMGIQQERMNEYLHSEAVTPKSHFSRLGWRLKCLLLAAHSTLWTWTCAGTVPGCRPFLGFSAIQRMLDFRPTMVNGFLFNTPCCTQLSLRSMLSTWLLTLVVLQRIMSLKGTRKSNFMPSCSHSPIFYEPDGEGMPIDLLIVDLTREVEENADDNVI